MRITNGIKAGMTVGMMITAFVYFFGFAAQADVVEATVTDWRWIRDLDEQDGTPDTLSDPGKLIFTGDDENDAFFRTVAIFELPTLGPGEYLDGATFSMKINNVITNGTPAIPNLSIAFLDMGTNSSVSLSDYNSSYTAIINSFATPSDAGTTQTWSNADLVTAISNAYDTSGSHIAFRFQMEETGNFYDSSNSFPISDGDEATDQYQGFNTSDSIGLELSVIPEPASVSMLVFAAAIAGALRHRLHTRR
jgi:hypothetical protein